ncbi:MAG: hypothetical protein RLZZ78_393 [Armatimonadota bacterium]
MNSSPKSKPSLFSLDLRSLAATRIAAGVYLLCDVVQRMGDASAHYSDAGVFPLSALREWWDGRLWWMLTVHSLDSGTAWPLFVFGIQLIFAVLMIIGFQSRFAVTVSWLLLISVQNRNPIILHGGDQMLRATMFWLMFLPVGARWSLDGSNALRRAYGQPVQESLTSIASAGLLLQTTIVYLSTAFLKHSKEWWSEGSAMYYALNIEQFRLPLGGLAKNLPPVFLRISTWMTLVFEIVAPLVVFSQRPLVRTLTIGAAFTFHLIFVALLMDVGPISIASCILWLPFIHGSVWDVLATHTAIQPIRKVWSALIAPVSTWRGKRIARWVKLEKPIPIVQTSIVAQVMAALSLLYILHWNAYNLNPSLKQLFTPVANTLRLDQYWGMFAPKPMQDDGWFSLAALLDDGSRVDLFQDGRTHTFERPADVVHMHKTARRAKYWMNLWMEKHGRYRKYGVAYMRAQFQAKHPEREIKQLSLYYHLDVIPAPGQRRAPVQPTLIWTETYVNASAPPLTPADE